MNDFVAQQTKLFNPRLINGVKEAQRQRAVTFGLTERPSQITNANLGYNTRTGKFVLANAKGNIGSLAKPLYGNQIAFGYGSNPLSDGNTVKF